MYTERGCDRHARSTSSDLLPRLPFEGLQNQSSRGTCDSVFHERVPLRCSNHLEEDFDVIASRLYREMRKEVERADTNRCRFSIHLGLRHFRPTFAGCCKRSSSGVNMYEESKGSSSQKVSATLLSSHCYAGL